jgi:hypothetical protein
MSLAIFLPKQAQGYALAPQFLMDVRPIWQSQGNFWGRIRNSQQTLQNLFIGPLLWQRPAQASQFRPFEIVSHDAGGHRATASDFPNGKLMLEFKSKYFFDLTHGFVGSCHWLPFRFEKGPMVPTYPASLQCSL